MEQGARKPSPQKRPQKKKTSRMTRIVIGFFLVLFVMIVGIGGGFLTASMNTKPDLINDFRPPASSQIYDINGKEIASIHATENRIPVKLDQVPKNLQDAFVAVEDNRFYDHMGIDPRGIIRAVYANLRGREVTEGGSTITQQLAKNAYLTQERTLKRKIQEVFLAIQLEHQYTKQEILELYLNQIYFGQGAYGVQAAAKTYFGKNVEDLTLSECAMLAGLPKSPNYYSPLNNPDVAKKREVTVLDQMKRYGYITASEEEQAKEEKLNLVKAQPENSGQTASYFVDYVTQKLIDKYGADAVYKDGLQIYTSLDLDMQQAAETAMKELPDVRVDSNGVQQPQGAIVAIDPHNGYVKAMVGGRGTDKFNRATMAERQPGSAFKPFVFAAALENNFTPSSIIEDSPIDIGGWSPQNADRRFRGAVALKDVARLSINVPTIKLAQKLGIEKPIHYAQEMGISTFVLEGAQNDGNLSTAIGGLTRGVTPLGLVAAYDTFANKGVHVDPVIIVKVLDRNGKVLEEAQPNQKTVISENSAWELTGMLREVIAHGTGTLADIGRPAAGKTGTTSDYHDTWFIGYTPDLVAGVWVGNDDNTSLGGGGGGVLPARIWNIFMSKALASTPVKDFEPPAEEQKTADNGDGNDKNGGGSQSSSDSPKKQGSNKTKSKQGTSNDTGGGTPAREAPAASAPAASDTSPSGGTSAGAPNMAGGSSKGRN